MGVPGFWTYVQKKVANSVDAQYLGSTGKERTVMLVDLSAFAFFVLKELGEKVKREHAGDYAVIEIAVDRILSNLIKKHGMKLVFVQDGPNQSTLKDAEKMKRDEDRMEIMAELERVTRKVARKAKKVNTEQDLQEEWSSAFEPLSGWIQPNLINEMDIGEFEITEKAEAEALVEILDTVDEDDFSDGIISDPASLPVPPLFLDAVCFTIEQAAKETDQIMFFQAEGEADMVLSHECAKLQKEGVKSFVCSNDSDFFFVQNLQFVPISSLNFDSGFGLVYDVGLVSERLGLTPSSLIELALKLGTDYTEKTFHRISEIDMIVKNLQQSHEPADLDTLSPGAQYAVKVFHNQFLPEEAPRYKVSHALPFPKTRDLPNHIPVDNPILVLRKDENKLIEAAPLLLKCEGDPGKWESEKLAEASRLFLLSIVDAVFEDENTKVERTMWEEYKLAYLYQVVCKLYRRCFPSANVAPSMLYKQSMFFPQDSVIDQPRMAEQQPQKPHQKPDSRNHHLPVDDHKDEIYEAVESSRVVILTAETGAGKSSRVPLILLEKYPHAKMMICQPRRIAAKTLFERTKQELGKGKEHLVGLRMSGVRDEDDSDCQIRFATTGYMVRYLAGNQPFFHDHDFIILDEIHERSLDMDILCHLAKQFLEESDRIKIILMSATLEAEAYREYFSVTHEPLFIGAKRFGYNVIFAKDIEPPIPITDFSKAKANLIKQLHLARANRTPTVTFRRAQYELCVPLIRSLYQKTPAVLVFVAGIMDINALYDMLLPFEDQIYTLAMHSSLSDEDQKKAWDPAPGRKLKVILATNMAESSITLPDLDVVICLGSQKRASYNAVTRTTTLNQDWISKASATQRAGRTGRVREGTVYRLYSEELLRDFRTYDPPEIMDSCLESTVILAKSIFNSSPVLPWLEGLMDPPDPNDTTMAMQHLSRLGALTSSQDDGSILTGLGEFVADMAIDITLCIMIAVGAKIDCAAEAVALAAIFSVNKSPFRWPAYFYCTPDEYNRIARESRATEQDFSGKMFSGPLSILRLLSYWQHSPSKAHWFLVKNKEVKRHEMYTLVETYNQLKRAVHSRMPASLLQLESPAKLLMNAAKLNRVRFLVFLSCRWNILQLSPPQPRQHPAGFSKMTSGFSHTTTGIKISSPNTIFSVIVIDCKPLPSLDVICSLFHEKSKWNLVTDSKKGISFSLPTFQREADITEAVSKLLCSPTDITCWGDEPNPQRWSSKEGIAAAPESQNPAPLVPSNVARILIKSGKKKKKSKSDETDSDARKHNTKKLSAIIIWSTVPGKDGVRLDPKGIKNTTRKWFAKTFQNEEAPVLLLSSNDSLRMAFSVAFPNIARTPDFQSNIYSTFKLSHPTDAIVAWLQLTLKHWGEFYIESDEQSSLCCFVGHNWTPTSKTVKESFPTMSEVLQVDDFASAKQFIIIENDYKDTDMFLSMPSGVATLGCLRRRRGVIEYSDTNINAVGTETTKTLEIQIPKEMFPKVSGIKTAQIPWDLGVRSSFSEECDEDYSESFEPEGNFFLRNCGIGKVNVAESSLEVFACEMKSPTQNLFAVARELMLSGSMVLASQLTVLPAGEEWIKSALACIGGQLNLTRLNEDDAAHAQIVQYSLTKMRGETSRTLFNRDSDMTIHLDQLFASFQYSAEPLPDEYVNALLINSPVMKNRPSEGFTDLGSPVQQNLKESSSSGSGLRKNSRRNRTPKLVQKHRNKETSGSTEPPLVESLQPSPLQTAEQGTPSFSTEFDLTADFEAMDLNGASTHHEFSVPLWLHREFVRQDISSFESLTAEINHTDDELQKEMDQLRKKILANRNKRFHLERARSKILSMVEKLLVEWIVSQGGTVSIRDLDEFVLHNNIQKYFDRTKPPSSILVNVRSNLATIVKPDVFHAPL